MGSSIGSECVDEDGKENHIAPSPRSYNMK